MFYNQSLLLVTLTASGFWVSPPAIINLIVSVEAVGKSLLGGASDCVVKTFVPKIFFEVKCSH